MNLRKITCRALVVSVFALSVQGASAGMIGAEQAMPSGAQADRTLVLEVLARSDTSAQLESMGLDPQRARERVAAMSDQEVGQLAQEIRTAPAGGNGWGVAAVIIIAAAVWYFVFRK
ncbi:PA2779 family protein [Ramlibacter sp. MMS24-I3-19]|uniref:PA2779 family protein n=1 Tax=Ramlibacter sp. MMS24-I3-19 TaxID=3416606 RepID=UPI003D010233